ncbi:hypothetical protein [Patulibacter defluvii]|uniref:hypothetical protein n=1 Tax=Patulibacter defluvii TaxID=3095358 RepID=UPI002A755558|nr:hypothetical protein [Patulibacter sp. DM4]
MLTGNALGARQARFHEALVGGDISGEEFVASVEHARRTATASVAPPAPPRASTSAVLAGVALMSIALAVDDARLAGAGALTSTAGGLASAMARRRHLHRASGPWLSVLAPTEDGRQWQRVVIPSHRIRVIGSLPGHLILRDAEDALYLVDRRSAGARLVRALPPRRPSPTVLAEWVDQLGQPPRQHA